MYNPNISYDNPLECSFDNSNDDLNYYDDDKSDKNNLFYASFNEYDNQSLLKENPNNIINLEEKSTAIKTLNNSSNENIFTEKIQNRPKFYDYQDICSTLKEAKFNLLDNFEKDGKIEEEENEEIEINRIGRKRNRKSDEKTNTNTYGKGRKKRNDKTIRNHNKYIPDNIIKKIKAKFIENLLLFVNILLNIYKGVENQKILKELDYKYINQLNKVVDLQMLDMTIKDLLSQDISPKFSSFKKDFNKTNINYILEENNVNEIIKVVFNMTFREWINIYTLKKKVSEIENVSDEARKTIEDNLPKLDVLLNDIYDNNGKDNKYLSYFIFYLFNYENWFFNKRERKKRNQKV